MERYEFLEQLKSELSDSLTQAEISEQVDYYNQYIGEETAKGTPEAAVIEDLGDPWIIARRIIEKKERQTGGTTYVDQEAQAEQEAKTGSSQTANRRQSSGAFTYIMVIVVAVLIILAIVGTAVGALAFLYRNLPIIFVIVIAIWVFHRLRN